MNEETKPAPDLAQRVVELEAERDEWRRIASAYSPAKELAASLKQAKASGDAARKERDELRTRLAVLDADAARYRWLKTRPTEVPTNGPDLALWSDSCGDELRGDDADAAIDAAMAAAPEHKA